jgi:uncharacterized protein
MADKLFVGREEELNTFDEIFSKNQSDLVVVLGRRRIGKTFLVKNAFKSKFDFHFTGVKSADKDSLLNEFSIKISEMAGSNLSFIRPNTWLDAFRLLKSYLITLKSDKKKIVFLDEMPWLDTHKSGFLSAFEFFWNDWAVDQNIVIVVCGSSTSWMMNNIVNNKAGLHNRITKYINLAPFTLKETKQLLLTRGINMPHYEIVQIYMALGGVPYYLNEVKTGESAIQNIDRILFNEKSTLKNEFQNLYRALFDNYEKYETVVKVLSTKQKGLTRQEIIDFTKISNGGGLTRMLKELEESSFIKTLQPFGKDKKEALYRLVDEYSVFYFQFNPLRNQVGSFMKISTSAKYKSWAGFAFESLCMNHIYKIKEVLGISGIFSQESSFVYKNKEQSSGFQIDMLIDRSDNSINLCEMKFYGTELEISKKEADLLRNRRELFREKTNTKKYLINTLITTYGIRNSENSVGVIDKVIVIDQLF